MQVDVVHLQSQGLSDPQAGSRQQQDECGVRRRKQRECGAQETRALVEAFQLIVCQREYEGAVPWTMVL
jgi:hypothetical protein